MNKIIVFFVVALTTLSIDAAQKVRVSLIKQYPDSVEFQLPEKAIERKMHCLEPANVKFAFNKRLNEQLAKIADEDLEFNAFIVNLYYAGAGIAIEVDSRDILDLDKGIDCLGDIVINRRHFIVVENEDNKTLLKHFFKKDKSKEVLFQRVFEKAIDVIEIHPTQLKATFDERTHQVETHQLIINGIDKLHAPLILTPAQPEQNIEEDDAFKIDVELFEE